MQEIVHTETAEQIMNDFAQQTGLLATGTPPRRYLWTDAFAVCNFLGLHQLTADDRYLGLARVLVDQVHTVLGRHRQDDSRSGPLSGENDEEAGRHPTRGGLRIGKKLNERRRNEPVDHRLEWDRDGQYFHYLTKWMHALDRMGQVSKDAPYQLWAVELARTAHRAFTHHLPDGRKRMYWKMSIDLSYPQVLSMGQHDPLDGLVTFTQLQAHASAEIRESARLGLSGAINDMAGICRTLSWYTDDPLGIGGLLTDAYRVVRMMVKGEMELSDLPAGLLDAARQGLAAWVRQGDLRQPARYRLAFRELGLSIGLKAVSRLEKLIEQHPGRGIETRELGPGIEALKPYAELGDEIDAYWLDSDQRRSASWSAHADINGVMLATSLIPDGYLIL